MNFDLQDLSGTFSTFDIIVSLSLAFVLSAVIGWVYRYTHKNVSYSQSYVQTLVMVGMISALIMLVVGSYDSATPSRKPVMSGSSSW